MHATPPSAIHAPAKVCGDYKPQNMNVMTSAVLHSPDCKWVVVLKGEDGLRPDFPFKGEIEKGTAYVADARTGRIIAQFEMVRSASLHWLKDERYLVVNYYEGSSNSLPLLLVLKTDGAQHPVDLAALVRPDVLRRANRPYHKLDNVNNWVYHYYAEYIEDSGRDITIAVETTLARKQSGDLGGVDKCYTYKISKTTLKYHFLREYGTNSCPQNPDEKWD